MVRSIPLISSSLPNSENHHSFANKWNLLVFVIGVFTFNLDLVFLYLPKDCGSTSICMDKKLGVVVSIIRTIGDVSFVTAKSLMPRLLPVLHDTRRLELAKEPKHGRNYIKSTFIIDLLAIMPLPQIIIWHMIHTSNTSVSAYTPGTISTSLAVQFSCRIIAMFDASKNTFKIIGIMMRNAWTGALLNLAYFMIVSHIWGALYYDMYISKLLECKNIVPNPEANPATLNWDQVLATCTQHDKFEIGMFSDAFTTKIVMRSFAQKYVFCLSWGLKSLSSFGQIFTASSYVVDTLFSFLTVIFGLILFGDLLARMQSGLESTEAREGKQRTRQRLVDEWMAYHQLPQGLKRQVKQAIQSEWSATRGISDESLLNSLPWDVRCEVRRHLYLDIIQNLPPFAGMNDHLVKQICGRLRTYSSNEHSYVAFEGEPVWQLIFIFSGELEVCDGNSGGQSMTLGPGDMCGCELLQWCSLPTRSTDNLPSSTQTVKCLTNVDAFSLVADDVKLLAIEFHRDGKFRHAFQRYAA